MQKRNVVEQGMKRIRTEREEEILTMECLVLGIAAKEVLRTEAPLIVFCSFVCTPADARLFGLYKREAEVTAPLETGVSVLVPFPPPFVTDIASTLFFKPSPRAPLVGNERL